MVVSEEDTPEVQVAREDDVLNAHGTVSKVVETGFLILTWLAMSSYGEIYGPTMIDLKLKLGSDYEQLAVAISGRSVGWFPGSILAGFLADRYSGYCHLMIAIGLDMAALASAAVPWSPNLTYMWMFCFVGGFVDSILNIAGTRILFNIWKEKSVSPLLLIHLGYGIGSFLVPLYSNYFLADIDSETLENNTSTINNTTSTRASTSVVHITTQLMSPGESETLSKDDSKIEYAYAISASIAASVSVAFYIYQIRESRNCRHSVPNNNATKEVYDVSIKSKETNTRSKQKRSFKEMVNPATCANGRFCYGVQILFLLFLHFGNIGGGDRMIGSFIRSYSIDQLHFSKNAASYLNTAYWISFSVGRLLFSLFASCISVRILIVVEAGGMALSSVLLVIFAGDSPLSLWILISCFAFFCSAIWPTGVAWTDYHIELTGLGLTLQMLGASVGGICHMRLIGYLYEHYGPKTFLFQILGYGIFQFVIASALDIVGAQHGNRFTMDEQGNQSGDKVSTETITNTEHKL